MKKRTVTVMIRHRGADGKWRRDPAARGGYGRIKPNHAVINGEVVQVENGTYELRSYENRKLIYTPVGKNAADADARRHKLETVATAKAVAADAGIRVQVDESRKSMRGTAAAYIAEKEDAGKWESAEQARHVTTEFFEFKKNLAYVDEIRKQDILDFHKKLKARKCSERTVANKHGRLVSWLMFAGMTQDMIPEKPRFDLTVPTIYTSEQTASLLAAATPYMRVCILLALKCGLREQELSHLEFSDIDWSGRTLKVQSKTKWSFRVKTGEHREVAVPDDLIGILNDWRQVVPSSRSLVLGTSRGQPSRNLLHSLKSVARKAGLNCGECSSCLLQSEDKQFNKAKKRRRLLDADMPEIKLKPTHCREYTLHRFRRTFLTKLLRSGIDLRTVQQQAGHSDLKSTMRYLRPASGSELQTKINAIEW